MSDRYQEFDVTPTWWWTAQDKAGLPRCLEACLRLTRGAQVREVRMSRKQVFATIDMYADPNTAAVLCALMEDPLEALAENLK